MGPFDVPQVRPARPADHPAVVALLSDAFLDADFAYWLVPDRAARQRIYPAYFELCMVRAFTHAQIEVTDDLGAVAIWYPYDGRTIPDTLGYDDRLQEITGAYHDRFLALDAAVDAHHPREPHHHLAWVVVHPDRQGRGYGTALLHYHHSVHLDGDGGARLPAYLEATGERNQWLYKRHGYTSLPPFPIAPGAPYLRPMWRDPH